MVAIKAAGAESFVARPDPGLFCLLVYGPDLGLVAERAALLARSAVDDPEDAFALVADGRRRSRLRSRASARRGPHNSSLRRPPRDLDSRRVAPDPRRRGKAAGRPRAGRPHRHRGRRSQEGRPVARAVREKRQGRGSTLLRRQRSRDFETDRPRTCRSRAEDRSGRARQALLASLGSDRLATRQEVGKLALYAHGEERVNLAHVDAVVADVSAIALDDAVDAAFTGQCRCVGTRIGFAGGIRDPRLRRSSRRTTSCLAAS